MTAVLHQLVDDPHAWIRDLPKALEFAREIVLANLVLIGEIPAPTFDESARVKYLVQRFAESGLHSSSDEIGNGVGILNGSKGHSGIVLVAHADTVFPKHVNHSLSVQPDRVIGPAVADNTLGLAVLASLPTVFEHIGIELQSDLILIGSSRNLGSGNLEGLRFFLSKTRLPISLGICVDGVQLGRLDYASLATLGGEIRCKIPDDSVGYTSKSAISVIYEIIKRLHAITLPAEPHTSLVLGSIHGVSSFDKPAKSATLKFRLESQSDLLARSIEYRIKEIVEEVSQESTTEVSFDVISRSAVASLNEQHPLIRHTREVMDTLGISPHAASPCPTLSCFIERDIPAIALAMSLGGRLQETNEWVAVNPIARGLAQLIGILTVIDGDYRD